MKKSVQVCLLLFLTLTGCSKYQYVTLNSDLPKNPKGEVVYETDSLVLRYKVFGQEGPARFFVYNKLQDPLYINWKESGIIIVNNAGGKDSVRLKKEWQEDPIKKEENSVLSVIQPGGFIASYPIHLRKRFIQLSYGKFETKSIGENSIRSQHYQQDNSPLRFRSFLTLSSDKNFSKNILVSNDFWVSEVSETVVDPLEYELYNDRRDKFHISKSNGLGFFGGTMGVLGYVVFMMLDK